MIKQKHKHIFSCLIICFLLNSCNVSKNTIINDNSSDLPLNYSNKNDTVNIARINWRNYFTDTELVALIDLALNSNQELNILLQEIEISKNEVRSRKGDYLPTLNFGLGASTEKSGTFTRIGAIEHQLEIKNGTPFPEPMSDLFVAFSLRWEVDIWKKLRSAKKSAVLKYLSTIEGRNFMKTNLIAEVADAYYELQALENLRDIIEKNIQIQSNALKTVVQQKYAAKVSQLAVNRFEAQLLNTKNLQFSVKQKIIETQNQLNYLTGQYTQTIKIKYDNFLNTKFDSIHSGIPSQLLLNRADVRQAEFILKASRLDVKVAKANFYPSFGIKANSGFQAFNPSFLINPASLMYNLAGDILAPLINRNAIIANYKTASAKQIQALLNYQKTILNAYVDVLNQLAKTDNYLKSYETKEKEVELLLQSVNIANNLFNAARADYAEVLLTQREALDAKIDLIEIKLKQLSAKVNVYRALGGGWR